MERLSVRLENCWGIGSLEHDFDFTNGLQKAFAIYAPNGVMKSSFAKTFEAISEGRLPQEERYRRTASCEIISDGSTIAKEIIYVHKHDPSIRNETDAVSNLLVNPLYRDDYKKLTSELEDNKRRLIRVLNGKSKVTQKDIEGQIKKDCNSGNFPDCISMLLSEEPQDLDNFVYDTIFNPKAIALISSDEFEANMEQFRKCYDEIFEQEGTIYRKGDFNPTNADIVFDALNKQGFFKAEHRVHLRGDSASIDKDELDTRLKELNALIDENDSLKKIRKDMGNNVETRELTVFMESLSATQLQYLFHKLKRENRDQFRKELWTCYVHNCPEAKIYLDSFGKSKTRMEEIENDAARIAPKWERIVRLFNDRFVDMPFTPNVSNQTEAALGRESAKLSFIFTEGNDTNEYGVGDPEIKTLSSGEERVLNLLYFIFEVEDRKQKEQETLFIIDDIADSFDYKNKHAIIMYLKDLCKYDFFHQIILTHNFDFYRAISYGFVHRDRCLMANKGNGNIHLIKAEGINNIFVNLWKDRITTNDTILYATVPFTRNLIEYTKGDDDENYSLLTSLLHWKQDTASITVGQYMDIYNAFFHKSENHDNSSIPMVQILFDEANRICDSPELQGLDLAEKVLMSIAIRMKAEIFMTKRIRSLNDEPEYWCQQHNQFARLYDKLISSTADNDLSERSTLDKISISVSSNIHLNSFMYEPIIDLSIEYLIELYREIEALYSSEL